MAGHIDTFRLLSLNYVQFWSSLAKVQYEIQQHCVNKIDFVHFCSQSSENGAIHFVPEELFLKHKIPIDAGNIDDVTQL